MPRKDIVMFNCVEKEKFLCVVHNKLKRLYNLGISQTDIAIYLDVTDRAIRKWERFESVPSGVQYYNLVRLCKELGA